MKVAEMIRKTRIESGLTQEEYGMKFGVTRQTVSSWENDRSLPDLQMLIDICNTYHVSLDKLLNDDKEFVDKIDYYNRFKRIIKRIAALILIVMIIFSGFFIRWKIVANEKNAAFSEAITHMGFVKDEKNGMYVLRQDEASFSLPNQKLPFLKDDFYVKNAYADLDIDGTEIGIIIYDGMSFKVEINHYRHIIGVINKEGKVIIDDNNLNEEEAKFCKANKEEIHGILRQMVKIHDSVYSN